MHSEMFGRKCIGACKQIGPIDWHVEAQTAVIGLPYDVSGAAMALDMREGRGSND